MPDRGRVGVTSVARFNNRHVPGARCSIATTAKIAALAEWGIAVAERLAIQQAKLGHKLILDAAAR
jgi:hypothetical protein